MGQLRRLLLLPTTSSVFRLPFHHESFRANVLRMLGIMSVACLMGKQHAYSPWLQPLDARRNGLRCAEIAGSCAGRSR